MFTRTVEVITKSGRGEELANTINDKMLPTRLSHSIPHNIRDLPRLTISCQPITHIKPANRGLFSIRTLPRWS